jgi:hypothetical protein
MKEKVLDVTLWRTRFGKGYGPVERQKAELKMPILKERNTNAWTQFASLRRGDK